MGEEELLWNAVSEAVQPIAHLEKQWDPDKLEKKLREYFKKAAKGLSFGMKPWDHLVNEYADSVFSSIFSGLGDREWLSQADFVLCVDAGIKDLFPAQLFAGVPQQVFERVVLQATDRAFDEQHYWALRWETVQRVVAGKLTQKRVREALDTARAETVAAEPEGVEAFLSGWIERTAALLGKQAQGDPGTYLDVATAVELFQALVQEGGLPWKLTSVEGVPPPDWPGIQGMVQQAYFELSMNGGATAARSPLAMGAIRGPMSMGAGACGFGKAGGKGKGKFLMGKGMGPWSQQGCGWMGEAAGGELEPPAKRW
eukprot:CAMPEP_0179036132 /NCGR_PEP_ID=MMETSP0796-20121207/13460_1 /TAXON_ID=73915 /ORGANISM="Pyrodinium bahamense, Strain pbaha01" /LENGTH=312 /DNA_ID=CAMNT_0020732409 /DNA_START=41 /DNA_END=976 /DNA_ORIENTATION=+